MEDYISHLGVEVTWVATSNVQSYKDAVRDNTKVLSATHDIPIYRYIYTYIRYHANSVAETLLRHSQ